MTSTDLKNQIDAQITNETAVAGITPTDVGSNMKSTVDYTNQEVALKAPLASPTFTGTVNGITKTMVGLANVDNTSDLSKPVSTATQSALDLKAPLATYKTYRSLLTLDVGGFTEKVLENNTGITISWTNPINGRLQGTASFGTPFTLNKTFIPNSTCEGSDGVYFAIGWVYSTSIVRITLKKHDNTITGTPFFIDQPVEILIYN